MKPLRSYHPAGRAGGVPHARRARRAATAAAALAAAVAAFGVGPRSAQADTPGVYTMVASANTISVEVDAANVPLLAPQLVFLSPGTAQAELDSFGGSTAFAGAPFVGQTVEGVGGLVNGLGSGVIPPIPKTLPGYVYTINPNNPTADNSQGPYTLKANSGPTSSTATAGIAASSGQPALISSTSTATTSLDPATGALTSTATSITQPFAIGSLVQIGTIEATATMHVDTNGKLHQTNSLDLGSISIAGIKVGLTENGLQLGTTLLPPSLDVLNTLLSGAGISLKLLPATHTDTSVTSEGLQITLTQDLPVEGATALILTIGQAHAQLSYGLITATATATTLPTVTPPPPGIPTGVPQTPNFPGVPQTQTVVPVTQTTPNGSTTGPGTIQPNLAQLALRLGPDTERWYLILAAAALALTAASRAAAHLAIRRTSTSAKGTP